MFLAWIKHIHIQSADDRLVVRTFSVGYKGQLLIRRYAQEQKFVDFFLQGLHFLMEPVQFCEDCWAFSLPQAFELTELCLLCHQLIS